MAKLQTILPWPPSVNAMHRTFKGRVIRSERYRRWREDATDVLAAIGGPRGIAGPVRLELELRPGTRRAFDLDNRVKPVQDVLAAVGVIRDDRQVVDLHVWRGPQATPAERAVHHRLGVVLVKLEEVTT